MSQNLSTNSSKNLESSHLKCYNTNIKTLKGEDDYDCYCTNFGFT